MIGFLWQRYKRLDGDDRDRLQHDQTLDYYQ